MNHEDTKATNEDDGAPAAPDSVFVAFVSSR